jgi:transcription termination factor Rho
VSVLQRKELEDSPLADVHAIASELGIEGYRALRREDLIAAILDVQGGGEGDAGEKRARKAPKKADKDADEKPRRRSRRKPKAEKKEADAPIEEQVEAPGDEPEQPAAAEEDEADHETVTGVLDVQPNGSGFLRVEDGDDVYVSQAQIRRCELRAGDEVGGPARPPRRNERHPSLVRVSEVNGRDAEKLEERKHFDDLTPVHPTDRLPAPAAVKDVPFGKGSRVAIGGPPAAGATRLLREIVASLAKDGGELSVAVVLAGARPEEVTEWRAEVGVPVTGGSFDQAPEQQSQAAQLAVERGKRVAERGGDAVVAIDSLEGLEPGLARRLFGAGRKLQEGGSLTVVAAVRDEADLRFASTRIVLQGGTSEPTVAPEPSGTQRADLLE